MEATNFIIVTGASGWIGRFVCNWLNDHNKHVIGWDLKKAVGPWRSFAEIDISESIKVFRENSTHIIQQPDTLIHCAGYAHRPNETKEEIEKFYKINAEGTQNVVDWAKKIGIKKLVYLSSIAFYDWENVDELPITEEAPVGGTTAYAKSKLLGEEAVRNSGLDYRIVRLATVFGDKDRANFSKLAKAIKKRKFIIPGNGEARKSVISVEKAAEYICRYALMDNPKYKLVNLGYPNVPTLKEICNGFSSECDFPKVRSIPWWLLRGGGLIGDLFSRVKPSFPLTSSNVNKLSTSTWVDCSKASELFPDLKDESFKGSLKQCSNYYSNL